MTVEPMEGFDPYRAWLNVREVRRPLNAYQLLGLKTLEDDADTIRKAARDQRTSLHAHRYEATPEIWDQVYTELEEAIAILTDADRKAAYDASLQSQNDGGLPRYGLPAAVGARPSAPGGALRCFACGHENPPTRKFCANCGRNLWEPCYNCGTLSTAGEKYCGACGADLIDGIQKRVSECRDALREAERMRQEYRFGEAIDLLGGVSRATHARLADFARRAHALIEQYARDRDRLAADAESARENARNCLSSYDYTGAIHILQQVPPALRNNGLAHLLEEATGKADEVSRLGAELRDAVQQGRNAELLPKIVRLLTLKPDHAHARKLADRFRQRACEVAKQKLAQHSYDAALKLLEQIPKPAWNEEVTALYEETSELAWVWWNLQNAPVVDRALLNMASRLVKTSPDDAQARKLVAELQRRAERSKSDPRSAPVAWAKPPEETHIGCSIDWITGFQRIRYADGFEASLLRQHPGCFFIAAGLALQGLGKAEWKANLLPQQRSVMGRIGQLVRSSSTRSAWGLDLSSAGLKAVRLVLDPNDDAVRIGACDYVEHRKLLSHAANEQEERTLIEETLRVFQGRNEVKTDRICLGLPSRTVLMRRLKMPLMDPDKLPDAVRYEAKRVIPFPLDDLVWDYELLDHRDGRLATRNEQTVMLIAAKRTQLANRLACFENAAIKTNVIHCDCFALANFIEYEYLARESGPELQAVGPGAALGILDVGSDAANLIVLSPTAMEVFHSGFGAQDFTRSLVHEFQLTFAHAEELKRNPAIGPSFVRLQRAMDPVLENLVSEIHRAEASLRKSQPHLTIQRFLGVGGGMQTHGLLRYLRLGR